MRPAAILLLVLALPAQAGIARGPVLHASAPGTMTVTWDTAEEVVGKLEYGINGMVLDASEMTASRHHMIVLTDLEPGALYQFRVAGEGETNSAGTFRAGVVEDMPFRFTVAGDTRTQSFFHRVVLDRVMAVRPDLHMNTGDLVESGEVSDQWDLFFKIERDLLRHVPFLPVIGNHDKDENTFYDSIWCLPGIRDNPIYFSLRYGNALFLVLDSDEIGDGSTQQDQWVEQQLRQAAGDPGIRHIFPGYHVPPLSSGPHGNSGNAHMLGRLHALFKQAGVQLVFNGHDHTYERSFYDGIHYIVAGGGGAPQGGGMDDAPPNTQKYSQVFAFEYGFVVVDVDGDRLRLHAYNMDGDLIDRVELP
jgi:3',5'-cyclic AMP phosphodiesterase CpdA